VATPKEAEAPPAPSGRKNPRRRLGSTWRARLESALVNRDYARLWYGQAVSSLGDYVFDTTLVLWVATDLAKGRTWAPAAVSGVLVATGAAVILVGPAAGVFVDRWSRRAIMLGSEAVRAVVVGLLAVLAFLPTHILPTAAWLALIYAVVFVVNSVGQFFSPARFAVIGQIVSGDADRARASGIGQAATSAASILGPPLAAPLLFTVGLQWALILNALSYVASFAAVRSVRLSSARPSAQQRGSLRQDFVDGLRYFRRSRYLVALLTIAVVAQCGTGAMNALDVFFVTGNLHTPARLYGFLSTAFGVGAILGALWSGRVVGLVGLRRTTWLGLIVCGALICLYARQTDFSSGLVMLFVVALPLMALETSLTPQILRAAPPEYLGRVMAVFNPINQAASMLSVAVAGSLASTLMRNFHAAVGPVHIGRIDTIFTASGLLIMLAGVMACSLLPRDAASDEPDSADAASDPEPPLGGPQADPA
jgi:MFS family permease